MPHKRIKTFAVSAGSEPTAAPPPTGKLDTLVSLLTRPQGATLKAKATSWQAHSVRDAKAGALKLRHKLKVTAAKPGDGVWVYCAVPQA